MAESTRDIRRSVYQRELKSKFAQQKLSGITHEDLRVLTITLSREGPRRQLRAPEILLQVYRWAIELGQKVDNPADLVRPASIAKFEPRDRALTPVEIGLMYRYTKRVGTTSSIRAAVTLVAPGATGKSFWALEAAMAIACSIAGGDLVRLSPVSAGRVVYKIQKLYWFTVFMPSVSI